MRFLKTCVSALALLTAVTGAQAANLVENFNEPFVGWESRWFGAETSAVNYYVSEQGPSNADYRGAPDHSGLVLSDGDSYRDGGNYGQILISFSSSFGASLKSFSMDVASALPNSTLFFYDMQGATIASFVLPGSPLSPYYTPTSYTNVSVTSTNGIGGFSFTDFAQGNTIIDNLAAATVPEPASWAMMVLGFGAIGSALRRRKTASTVNFA
ncbi:PEPxxWA-CTERM sorting domain-containing protein [Glacieibacterium sp.]|uniref:PEPxxWA-CTERM sorting domain-containing protein n=1 Tax=Glacieibacterium sp. TaxID=2860237 RepID=UPI003B000BB1